MSARPDLTPNRGKKYQLKQILFRANPQRFQAFLAAHPDAVRAFLSDYVAVTKYYLENTAQAKTDIHKAGFVRTPLPGYLKISDWKRNADARVDVESLKKLAVFMQTKLGWLEKPVQVEEMVERTYLPR